MRIALLTYSTKPRGSVIHTIELAEALTALGHPTCIYALDKDGLGFGRSLNCSVRLVTAAPAPAAIDALIQQRIQEFVQALEADLNQADPFDIYHAQDCIGANALIDLRQRGHILALVRTVHHVEAYASPYLQHCQEQSIRQPDLCLCVSQHWQAILAQDYGITAPQVINGVNLARFSAQLSGREADLKQQYGLTGSPIFLTVGGIEPRKNSLRLLEAFAQVQQVYPTAQLAIAGGATLFDYQPYRAEFFALADRLGLEIGQDLILPGVVPDQVLPDLYRCADVFCFPSLKEGWGLVVMEAIASGLPVVVSQQPPFTEFLDQDQAVWVDPTSAATIATGLRQATNPQIVQIGRDRRQILIESYSWPRSAHLHLQHYSRFQAGQ